MTKTRFALLASAIALMAGGAVAATQAIWNWGTADDEYATDPGFAESKAICRRLGHPVIPVADRPTAAQTAALKGCDSEALYYGEGMAPDYVKARQCAVLEQGSEEGFFAGTTILMQVYANGQGTARNIDLATALACEIEGAPMENDGRVLHLQALAAKPGPFDVCDDITSGYAGGFCALRESTLAGFDRETKIATVAQRFPSASAPLFTEVKTAFAAFAEAHGGGEVDLSGTARGAFVVEEEDRERDQFLKDLTRLADGQWLKAGHAEAVSADAALNQSYRKGLTACVERDANYSTVRAEDIRTTQRLWLVYRDAYLRFAAVAAPTVTRDAILTRLTNLRTAELDSLPCE